MKIVYLTCAAVVVSSLASAAAGFSTSGTLKSVPDTSHNVAALEPDTDTFLVVARSTGSQKRPRARIKTATPRRKLKAPSRLVVSTAPAGIRAKYKKSTWQLYRHQLSLTGSQGTQAVPDTDCPPAPTQECLDSWKDANDDIANWPD